jgi:hypothetical protein
MAGVEECQVWDVTTLTGINAAPAQSAVFTIAVRMSGSAVQSGEKISKTCPGEEP